jgi:transposase-like protein
MHFKSKRIEIKKENDQLIIEFSAPVRITLPINWGPILVLILRSVTDLKGKSLLSFQEISNILGHSGRQWSHNIYQAWKLSGKDLKLFLQDKRELSDELLNIITEFVLLYPLRSILDQHREFLKVYPQYSTMCINSFRAYVSATDCCKLITAFSKQLQSGKLNPKSSYFIMVLQQKEKLLSLSDRAYIADLFPTNTDFLKGITGKDIDWSNGTIQKHLLICLLYTWGVSQENLSLLFGVSKSTIHDWVHKFNDEKLQGFILKMIGKWSGKICVDEKWIKIKGKWQYIFSAVDSRSGIPIFIKRFTSVDTASWTLFFIEFKMYYGFPLLITSDGSKSLLAARKIVFPRVRHQLCWFHKLKNLHKRIYKEIKDPAKRKRAIKLASGMFNNKHISSRKKAALQLSLIGGENIRIYIIKSILKPWLKFVYKISNM